MAIKLIYKKEGIDIEKEVKIMEKLSNNNSVKIIEKFDSYKEYAIVMELCDCNLKNKLDDSPNGFNINEIKNILTQLNNTFRIMLNNKIIHRDIKLENILVKYINEDKNNYIVKLGDYGISKQLSTFSQINYTFVGTIRTEAPEILKGKPYDGKCDLWSLGIIIYQMYFKQFPYTGVRDMAILEQIENLKQTHFKKTGDENLDDLISKLLIPIPEDRLSWEQYFNHPFFK